MKKLFALLICAALCTAMSVTAFAADINQDSDPKSGSANVKATAQLPTPTYTVTIPAEIDFGTITKSATESLKTQPIAISASDVTNLNGKSVDVSVTGSFSLASGANTLPFEVYALSTGGTALASGDSFAAFTEDGSVTGRLQLDEADITAAGDYTGTLTFGISLKP